MFTSSCRVELRGARSVWRRHHAHDAGGTLMLHRRACRPATSARDWPAYVTDGNEAARWVVTAGGFIAHLGPCVEGASISRLSRFASN